jgi:hypothetical protein
MLPHCRVTRASPFLVTAGKPGADSNAYWGICPQDKEKLMRHTRILAFGLLLTLAACGQPATGDGVASAGGTPAASAAGPAARDEDAPLKFSQCMREQGMTWFPDPQPGGGLQVKVPPGTDKAKVDAAMAACKEFAPDGGPRDKADPQQLEQARQMSQCMRDNGVPDFPDPDADGNMRLDGDKIGMGPGDPTFDRADQACAKFRPQGRIEGHAEGGK